MFFIVVAPFSFYLFNIVSFPKIGFWIALRVYMTVTTVLGGTRSNLDLGGCSRVRCGLRVCAMAAFLLVRQRTLRYELAPSVGLLPPWACSFRGVAPSAGLLPPWAAPSVGCSFRGVAPSVGLLLPWGCSFRGVAPSAGLLPRWAVRPKTSIHPRPQRTSDTSSLVPS